MSTSERPPRTDDLDRRITELLGRALAETPPPPELGDVAWRRAGTDDGRRPNRWFLGAAVGLGTAAAIVGLLVIPNVGDDPELPTADGTSDVPAPIERPPTIVLAGPEGIAVRSLDGVETSIGTSASAIALEGPDGRIYAQPVLADGTAGAVLAVTDASGGHAGSITLPVPPGSTVRLLDVATVDGEPTILYTVAGATCASPDDAGCATSVGAFRPATGANQGVQVIDERNGWEFEWGGLSLADNGLVVGEAYAEAGTMPMLFRLNMDPAPTPASVGLAESYFDCNDCPTAFTIDRTGRFAAWIAGPVGERRLVVVEVATGVTAELPVRSAELDSRPGRLDIADVELDASAALVGGHAVFTPAGTGGGASPVLIDLATGSITALTPGTIATLR